MKAGLPDDLPLYTSRRLWNRLVAVLDSLKPSLPDSPRVLDFPAGSGKLSQLLKGWNWNVYAGDWDETKWKLREVPFFKADMASNFPWESESYDLVICFEGIKHSSNPQKTISEFSRVVKKGGYFIITIPNDLDLQTRLRYLFDGFVNIDWKKPLVIGSLEDLSFLYPKSQLSLPFLYYLLEREGFQYLGALASHYRKFSVLLYLLLFPLIFLFTLKACGSIGHPLFRILLQPVWQCGKRNIILTRKV